MKKYIKAGSKYIVKGSQRNGYKNVLRVAAFCSRADVIKLIIERHKKDVANLALTEEKVYKEQISSALIETCKINNKEIAKILLDEGADATERIHDAVGYGSWGVLDVILKNQSNDPSSNKWLNLVNARDNNKNTPLHIVSHNGFTPTAR